MEEKVVELEKRGYMLMKKLGMEREMAQIDTLDETIDDEWTKVNIKFGLRGVALSQNADVYMKKMIFSRDTGKAVNAILLMKELSSFLEESVNYIKKTTGAGEPESLEDFMKQFGE